MEEKGNEDGGDSSTGHTPWSDINEKVVWFLHPHSVLPRIPRDISLKYNVACNYTMTKSPQVGIYYSYKTISLLKLILS